MVEKTNPFQVSPLRGNTIRHGRDRETNLMKEVEGYLLGVLFLFRSYALRVQGSHLLTLHLVHS
jgi:hypothetical protein